VNRLLNEAGLERYYQLKPQRTLPLLNYFDRRPSLEWLEQQPGLPDGHLELAVEGIQCGACVWAIEKVAARHGGARVGVNSALGRLSLRFEPGVFQPQAYISTLAELGYRVRPMDADFEDRSQGVLLRLGICAAASMNAMLLSLPFYLGLQHEDGSGFYTMLRGLSFGLTLFSVLFGGSYFLARAWRNLRQGVAHFDIPIALGMSTAFLGSTWAWMHDQGNTVYFDSVNLFLTFMLAGRFLQERALMANRRSLLRGDAFEHAQVTLLADDGPRDIPFPKVLAGDRLLLQPGSLCPAEAVMEPGQSAEFDRAAITGELRPASLKGGDSVAAGARLVSGTAARVRCAMPFSAGLLARLASASSGGEEELPVVWRWAVRWYVGLVLLAAAGGGAYWLSHDPSKAPQVFIATLVVTCPCGLGIAVPLARTLADRRLAASGLTVRQPGLLERLQGVKRVCLDKTGTLTFSHLELADPARLKALAPEAQRALMGAAGSSRHPISRSLFRELSARGVAFPEDGRAVEVPGEGVRWSDAHGEWFLGRSMDAGPLGVPGRAVLSHEGRTVAAFDLRERLLEDAAASLQALQAQGVAVQLLSGDEPARVRALAQQLGLEPGAARGGCSPDAKAAAVAEQPTLMLGDGLNDGLALGAARVSGTPSWERTVVADQADFAFASASLAWLPALFQTSRDLRGALWGNLIFAGAYNLVLLTFALRGAFSPVLCALTMPASSLVVIALTARRMRLA
jgi:Cu2+-exporting ATPase